MCRRTEILSSFLPAFSALSNVESQPRALHRNSLIHSRLTLSSTNSSGQQCEKARIQKQRRRAMKQEPDARLRGQDDSWLESFNASSCVCYAIVTSTRNRQPGRVFKN